MTVLTPDWLRSVAYALLVLSLIPIALALQQFLKSRRARYYILRQNARQRAGRWALLALALGMLAVTLLIATPRLLPVNLVPTFTPTVTPSLSPSPSPRPTRTPTATATPTRRPTATPPFIPTATPAIPLPESALSPLPSAVPAGEDARITLITLAADRDDSGGPVDPGVEFPPGDHRVYLFISYDGLADGTAWTFAIYREGEFLDGTTQLWEWGEQGKTFLYYKPPGGYEPGVYEMRVFIEERLQGVVQFVITDAVDE